MPIYNLTRTSCPLVLPLLWPIAHSVLPSSPFIQYGGNWTLESSLVTLAVGSYRRNSTFAIDFFGTAIYIFAHHDPFGGPGGFPVVSMSLDGLVSNYTVPDEGILDNPDGAMFTHGGLTLGWHHCNVSMGWSDTRGVEGFNWNLTLSEVNITTGDGLTRSVAAHDWGSSLGSV
jgi:hypothetical protein